MSQGRQHLQGSDSASTIKQISHSVQLFYMAQCEHMPRHTNPVCNIFIIQIIEQSFVGRTRT